MWPKDINIYHWFYIKIIRKYQDKGSCIPIFPLVPTTEETAKEVIGNLKAEKQQAYQTKNKKPIIKESNKDMALNKSISLDKSRSYSGTETEDTVKQQNKTR